MPNRNYFKEILTKDYKELARSLQFGPHSEKFVKLTEKLGKVVEDFGILNFLMFDLENENTVKDLLYHIDSSLQYGENLEVFTRDFDVADN